tara:strand:- start:164 stop:640 length:477 start_codon:yes stop_codon:yes gene_type:complete
MKDLILVKHASGAPGLRFFGLGPMFSPKRGILKLKSLLSKNTLWAKKRSTKDIKKMLSNSVVVVSVWKDNTMIGFGRATSDEIYRAVLWDIVVDKQHQNSGIGKIIVNSILENNLIAEAERIYVMTTNFETFYSKMGFLSEEKQKLMLLKKKGNGFSK